ncbi:MAG: hypothetical protein P1U30_09505 [Phycisphaerales bacterium]|nr:hypothetical protein [Phycisphaerales bacterium]
MYARIGITNESAEHEDIQDAHNSASRSSAASTSSELSDRPTSQKPSVKNNA